MKCTSSCRDIISSVLLLFHRFLLLPAFLGDLFLRQMAPDRMTILKIAKVGLFGRSLQVFHARRIQYYDIGNKTDQKSCTCTHLVIEIHLLLLFSLVLEDCVTILLLCDTVTASWHTDVITSFSIKIGLLNHHLEQELIYLSHYLFVH